MNYFQTLPEELTSIIFTYSVYHDINKLSKEFKLYIDYGELLRVRYPKNYVHLIKYVYDINPEYYYKILELNNFQDNLDEYAGIMYNIKELDNLRHHVHKLMAKIYLEIKYPELKHIFDKFPQDEHKYPFLLDAMDELEGNDDILSNLIFTNGDISKVNLEDLKTFIIDHYENLSHFYYNDRNKYYRDDIVDDSYFNYITKVIDDI